MDGGADQGGHDHGEGFVDLVSTCVGRRRTAPVGVGDVPREAVGLRHTEGRVQGLKSSSHTGDTPQGIGELTQPKDLGGVFWPGLGDAQPMTQGDRDDDVGSVEERGRHWPTLVSVGLSATAPQLCRHLGIHAASDEAGNTRAGEVQGARVRANRHEGGTTFGVGRARDVGRAHEEDAQRLFDSLGPDSHQLRLTALTVHARRFRWIWFGQVRGHQSAQPNRRGPFVSEVLRLHGLGAVVEVRCTGELAAETANAMRVSWTRCLSPAGGGSGAAAVEAEPLEVRVDHPSQLVRRLMLTTQDVTRSLIAARAGELLMFHAGAVSDPASGRSVAYVARGGTGKTTMSHLLGQRLGYLTDEAVGIDSSGAIHPYPKPLSVRRPAQPEIKDELSPDALGLLPAPENPGINRVVLLDRVAGTAGVEVEELAFMDGLFGLVEQSSALPELPRPLHQLADLIDGSGPVMRVRYAEAPDAADVLGQLVEAQA